MPSVRDLFRDKASRQPAAAGQIEQAPPSPPHVNVGDGQQSGRLARMVGVIRQGAREVNQGVNGGIRRAERAVNLAQREAENLAERAGRLRGQIAGRANEMAEGAREKARQVAEKASDAAQAVGKLHSKTVVPGLKMAGMTVGGFLASPAADFLDRQVQRREQRAERRFQEQNAGMIAALSRPPQDSIADRPGVRELLAQDIQRNTHGQPRMNVDEAVQMARIGQHIAQALANGAVLNANGRLPVEVDGQRYEVKPGSFASRALAWHMTAAAANSTLLRQQQNPGQDLTSDVTNSGTFVMKDPGGRIYNFLNANPQVQGRVSTHFADRIDNDDKILLGRKAVQRGYDDYLGKLPGQGGALLFDKMKNGELFIKVEHAGCPGLLAREGHHQARDIALRAPLAMNKWYEHTKSLKKSMAEGQGAPAVGAEDKHGKKERIDKGWLREQVGSPLKDALAIAEASGAITPKEAKRFYEGARKQGFDQVERVSNFLRGAAQGIPGSGLRNLLENRLDELNANLGEARANLAEKPKISRQEHIDKGMLHAQVGEKLQDVLALAEATGVIQLDEAERLYEVAQKNGLQQVEKILSYLQGAAEVIPNEQVKNNIQAQLAEISANIANVRNELDGLKQFEELGIADIDRRGAEVHVSLDPAQNPAVLPGAVAPEGAGPALNGPPPPAVPPPGLPPDVLQPVVAPGSGNPVVDAMRKAGQKPYIDPAPTMREADFANLAPGKPPLPAQPSRLPPDALQPVVERGVSGNPLVDAMQKAGQKPYIDPAPTMREADFEPKVAGVEKLTGGLKGVVFKVDYDDGSSQVVKLQKESPVAAIVGTQFVQEAGVLAPNMERIGGPGQLQRLDLAVRLQQADSPAAKQIANLLRGNNYPEAVVMDYAPGRDLGKAMQQPDFKQNVLLNERFQDQLGRLMAADAFAGNPDRLYGARMPGKEGLEGFINKGNLKIHGEGAQLQIIAIDNEFNPGAQFLGGIENISDQDLHGMHSGYMQVGSKAMAVDGKRAGEIGLVLDKMCKEANVQLSPQERQKFIQVADRAAAQTMNRMLTPGQMRQQQLQQLGVEGRDLEDFGRHKRGLKMLGRAGPAAGGDDLTVGQKLKLAAGSDNNHRQGFRAYMGKDAVKGDLPERVQDQAAPRVRNRRGPAV